MLTFAAQATPPRDPGATVKAGGSVIRGRVIAAATGQPLHRVRTTLNGSLPNPPTTATDTRSEFELTGVPAGSHTLTATRAGHLTIQYGQRRRGEPGRRIEVRDGEAREPIEIALPRASVLAGRVTDDTGGPYAGVYVEAVEFRYLRGRRLAVPAASTTSNDLGDYRLSGLSPGSYLLRASTDDTWESGDGRSTFTFAVTYYPGVAGTDGAETISIAPGQQLQNLNFGLRAGRTATITGVLQSAGGEPLAGQAMNLDRAMRGVGGNPFSLGLGGSTRTDRSGAFEFRNLAPGEYIVYSRDGADGIRASVVLADGDARHVVLAPRKPTALTGTIVTDEGTPPPFAPVRLRVTAIPTNPESLLPSFHEASGGTVGRDWTFRVTNLDGQYLFRLAELPPEWMVANVIVGGRSFTDAPLAVAAGGNDVSGVQLVVSRKGATIDGRVINADGSAAPDSTVILFAADTARWTLASRFVKAGRPDDRGRFAFSGLRSQRSPARS